MNMLCSQSQNPTSIYLTLNLTHLRKMLPIFFLLLVHLQLSNSILNHDYIYPSNSHIRLKSHTFHLTEGPVQPDNYVQTGYLINGQFPGPTIFVNQFDLLEIIVHNYLSVETTLHCHGILHPHTAHSDGVGYVTQYPIQPNSSFTYQIEVGVQTGTYMCHGHIGYDSVFIQHVLIIRDNPFYYNQLGEEYAYDAGYEFSFMFGVIYHYNLEQLLKDVKGPQKQLPSVQSIHINGLSYGIWPENNGTAEGYQIIPVVPGKTYRFRVINLATDDIFVFQIEGHHFKVIEMDGIISHPVWTDRLEMNVGQRYSILVEMDKKPDNYWISVETLGRLGPSNGKAILHYLGGPDPGPLRKKIFPTLTEAKPVSKWVLNELKPNIRMGRCPSEFYHVPQKADRKIVIDTLFTLDSEKIQRILINGYFYQDPEIPYLEQVQNGINISKDVGQVHEIFKGEVVDIVFQNRMLPVGICLEHPWHIHGHSFYLVAEGPDGFPDEAKLDVIIRWNIIKGTLQYRDVITLFPSQTTENKTSGAECGWSVIRFVANNPGVWMGHCHVNRHHITGKKFIIYEHGKYNPWLFNE